MERGQSSLLPPWVRPSLKLSDDFVQPPANGGKCSVLEALATCRCRFPSSKAKPGAIAMRLFCADVVALVCKFDHEREEVVGVKWRTTLILKNFDPRFSDTATCSPHLCNRSWVSPRPSTRAQLKSLPGVGCPGLWGERPCALAVQQLPDFPSGASLTWLKSCHDKIP